MSLTGVAKANLAIVEKGSYVAPSGRLVPLRELIDRSVTKTVLYRPDAYDALYAALRPTAGSPRIEVTTETTAEASRRLVEAEHEKEVVALNFASAKNPGGGYIRGAKAQEEDLARCSALYHCLVGHREYYDENRAHPSMCYLDYMMYSPEVPFFRDERYDLLEEPFLASIITRVGRRPKRSGGCARGLARARPKGALGGGHARAQEPCSRGMGVRRVPQRPARGRGSVCARPRGQRARGRVRSCGVCHLGAQPRAPDQTRVR